MSVNFQSSVNVLSTKGCPEKVCKPCGKALQVSHFKKEPYMIIPCLIDSKAPAS